MKKPKKSKNLELQVSEIAVGYLYYTTTQQYRAVLAMHGDFLIYAPSSEGMALLDGNHSLMPFENSPFKKCQIATFAKKAYQPFAFNGIEALKHQLNSAQLAEATAQCNAQQAIKALLAE